MNEKYTLKNIKEVTKEGRCGALWFHCKNEDCDYEFPKDDRTTTECPECGTLRKVCGKWPIKGRDRCARHGGKSPQGVMSTTYKGKGTSKHLPTRLFEYYQLALAGNIDGAILEMSDDILLLETRKIDLTAQLSKEGADILWEKARKAYDKFINARVRAVQGSAKAGDQMVEALGELEAILVEGYKQGAIWQQLLQVIQIQTKIKESEMKRRKEASTIVTEEQVATLVGRIIGIIKDRVRDQDTRSAILNDIQGMMIA